MTNQQPEPKTGDDFDIGDIKDSQNIAIGNHAAVNIGFSPEEVARLLAEEKRLARQEAQNAAVPLPDADAPIPKNPFGRAGKIQNPERYLIRRPLTREIIDELGKGASVSLVGASRTGKSSLLWHIAQTGAAALNRSPEDFLYLDMELVHNDDDFFEYLCAMLELPPNRGFRLRHLLRKRKIVLCLDEFEKMKWEGFTLTVRTELRGLADGPLQPFTLLIASRAPLSRLFPDSPEETSPLAGICIKMKMRPFTLAEARALTAQYLSGSGIMLPDEAVEAAWRQSDGHPQRLQMELKAAFDRKTRPDRFSKPVRSN